MFIFPRSIAAPLVALTVSAIDQVLLRLQGLGTFTFQLVRCAAVISTASLQTRRACVEGDDEDHCL
jgi:hypothetical protein